MNTDMNAIIRRIRKRREDLQYSFQDLADKTNMSKSTLQRYETGAIKNVPLDKLEVLARALEVTPAYLMGWEKEPTNKETDPLMIVATHHADYDWTDEEIEEIDNYINYVKSKKKWG